MCIRGFPTDLEGAAPRDYPLSWQGARELVQKTEFEISKFPVTCGHSRWPHSVVQCAAMSEHTPKLEQCVEETVEGSGKSQLVLHSKKPVMIDEGETVEAGLLASSHHSSPSASPNPKSASSDHAPEIEGEDEQSDKEGADTSKVKGGSGSGRTGHSTRTGEDGTGKTAHSTRTKRKHKTATRKRQHSEL